MGVRHAVCQSSSTQDPTTDSCSGIGISLYNGGAAGGIWMLVVVSFGMFHLMLSLAELVSM